MSLENLFRAWNEFKKGKEKKADVQEFALNLEDNLFELHHKLLDGTYQHSAYASFFVQDPKLRHIHKAHVVDRVLHHAIMNIIEPIFEKGFIFDSYSSRKGKGTHKAVRRFRQFAWRLSRNNTRTVWALQCDIRRFFDSIDHEILKNLIQRKIDDERAMDLISGLIDSFCVEKEKGMPLGNVTSQLFSNIYLNPFDQFIKRKLRVPFYLRYADDFVILAEENIFLERLIPIIADFLKEKLALRLHPKKIKIGKWNQGVDFLGYISLPHYTLVRTKTKRRMLKKIQKRCLEFLDGRIDEFTFTQSQQSYLGILKHCRGYNVEVQIKTLTK
ncbi:hypothetical protein HZA42_02570 [Candidatus Peregrinibacteria bacterium]|nr:hypothetical protein [Candidatus Peregrinibacteria bacterium]